MPDAQRRQSVSDRADKLLDAARPVLWPEPELRTFRCRNRECRRVMFEYRAPIGYLIEKCKRCGLYSELTTEP